MVRNVAENHFKFVHSLPILQKALRKKEGLYVVYSRFGIVKYSKRETEICTVAFYRRSCLRDLDVITLV